MFPKGPFRWQILILLSGEQAERISENAYTVLNSCVSPIYTNERS